MAATIIGFVIGGIIALLGEYLLIQQKCKMKMTYNKHTEEIKKTIDAIRNNSRRYFRSKVTQRKQQCKE